MSSEVQFSAGADQGRLLLQRMRDRLDGLDPLSALNTIGEDVAAELDQLLTTAGVRRIPAPFANAMTITSDTDRSTRTEYFSVNHDLVERLGLDFGDTVWLIAGTGDSGQGVSFLDSTYQVMSGRIDDTTPHLCRAEVLAEHHNGNLDHWHNFSGFGPRTAVMVPAERDGSRLEFTLPQTWTSDTKGRVRSFAVLAVDLLSPSADLSGATVEILGRNDRRLAVAVGEASPRSGGCTLAIEAPYPMLRKVERVVVTLANPPESDVPIECVLSNWTRDFFIGSLASIRDDYGYATTLTTNHGKYHVFTRSKLEKISTDTADTRAAELQGGPSSLYHGEVVLEGGSYTTRADDPDSHAFCMPEIVGEFGIETLRMTQGKRYAGRRFNVPDDGTDATIDEVVFPHLGGDGTSHYALSARFPQLDDTQITDAVEDARKTRADTFEPRLTVLLDGMRDQDDRFAVFYTHLGAWYSDHREGTPIRFEGAPSVRLRDRAFNIPDAENDAERGVWFTRGSVFTSYAIAQHAMPALVAGRDANRVSLERFDHPILNRSYPSASTELYGTTFFVEDAATARVSLDGVEIPELVRLADDGSGRPCVTIADTGIRHSLIGMVEPAVTSTAGSWSWQQGTGALAAGVDGVAAVAVAVSPDRRPACQTLTVVVRRDASTSLTIEWDSACGATFAARVGEPLSAAGTYAASRSMLAGPVDDDGWEHVVIPLYALDWHVPSSPELPLPNDPIEQLRFRVDGPAASTVEVRSVTLGRPRPKPHEPGDTVFVGGTVGPDLGGVEVRLRSLATGDVITTHSEDDGLFSLTGVPKGACEIVRVDGAVEPIAMTVMSSRFDLDLSDRPASKRRDRPETR